MSRNGAGVFAVLNPILVGALRSSAAVNADFTDQGGDITNTLPLDGTVAMTGQFKAADGSLVTPGMSFKNDTRVGFRRTAQGEQRWVSGGTDRFYIDANLKAWQLAAMDVAGATVAHGAWTGAASDPLLISALATNGVAKRTGDPAWAIEPFYYALHMTVGGYGTVLPTGVCGDMQAPVDGTIVAAALMLDQSGSVAVSVWRDSYANYPPTIADVVSSAFSVTTSVGLLDQTLSGWTTTIAAGDCLRFNIDSVTTITRMTIALRIKRYS